MTHTIAGTPAAGPNNGKTLRILQLYPKDMNITATGAIRSHSHAVHTPTGSTLTLSTTTPATNSPKTSILLLAAAARTPGRPSSKRTCTPTPNT